MVVTRLLLLGPFYTIQTNFMYLFAHDCISEKLDNQKLFAVLVNKLKCHFIENLAPGCVPSDQSAVCNFLIDILTHLASGMEPCTMYICLFSTYVRVKCVHKMFSWGIPILISTRASSMYNASKKKLSTIYLFEEQDTSEGTE